MAIKDRLARLEANARVNPQLSAAPWWNALLSKPKENEHRINAAYFLALDGIIQKPAPPQWKALQEATDKTATEMPDSLLAFCFCYTFGHRQDEEDEQEIAQAFFADDDSGRDWLCLIANTYWDVFKGAPLPSMPEAEKDGKGRPLVICRGRVRGEFTIPIFNLLFPELNGNGYHHFEEWLDNDGEVESLWQSVRAWMNERHHKPDMVRTPKENR